MPRSIKGRGAAIQPANPYLAMQVEKDLEHVEWDKEYLAELDRPPTSISPMNRSRSSPRTTVLISASATA